jgi:hypothetical protein
MCSFSSLGEPQAYWFPSLGSLQGSSAAYEDLSVHIRW